MSLRIQVVSDLHLEWQKDYGKSFIRSMPNHNTDALVIAGDLTSYENLEWTLKELCNKYSKVLFILGNHDFYGSDFISINKMMERISNSLSNLYWLENRKVDIDGVTFIGATLWFAETPDSSKYKHCLSDFNEIRNFDPMVYHKSDESARFIANNTSEGDIVITHHMMSYKSVAEQYNNDVFNIYFVRDMEKEIIALRPALVINGHTHFASDYILGNTRMLCNPFGYANYAENQQFKEALIIEV